MNAIACYKSLEGASLAVVAMEANNVKGAWVPLRAGDLNLFVVHAPPEDLSAAQAGIDREAGQHSLIRQDAVHCPECGGIHVEFPTRPEMSASAALTSKIAEITGMKSPSFLCRDCQYSWSEQETTHL